MYDANFQFHRPFCSFQELITFIVREGVPANFFVYYEIDEEVAQARRAGAIRKVERYTFEACAARGDAIVHRPARDSRGAGQWPASKSCCA